MAFGLLENNRFIRFVSGETWGPDAYDGPVAGYHCYTGMNGYFQTGPSFVHEVPEGLPIFPMRLIRGGGKIEKWPLVPWTRRRSTHWSAFDWFYANAVGVPTGRRSGLVVVDVDSHKPAYVEPAFVSDLPPTRTHATISGGRQLIFRHPAVPEPAGWLRNRGSFLPCVDLRGEGGLVVWAGGILGAGHYSVLDPRPIVELPEAAYRWLLETQGASLRRSGGGRNGAGRLTPPVIDPALLARLEAACAADSRLARAAQGDDWPDRSRAVFRLAHLMRAAGWCEEDFAAMATAFPASSCFGHLADQSDLPRALGRAWDAAGDVQEGRVEQRLKIFMEGWKE